MTTSLLIRGGLLLDPESHTSTARITSQRADLLVEAGRIAAVGPDLPTPAGAELIDAAGMIVLPGFVDTHRHTWQTALRSVAPDTSLASYLTFVLGDLAPRCRPQDVYDACLAGALEALNAGITTIADWSHLQFSPEHTDAAVEAFRRAGVRVLFGYGSPDMVGGDPAAPLPADIRRVHAEHFADPGGLLRLAIAARGPGLSTAEATRQEWKLAAELGIAIHVHAHGDDLIQHLRHEGLLASGTIYAHGNGFSDEALRVVADSGGAVAVSPLVEAQMGHGYPITGRALAQGVPTGLSVDAVTSAPGDMFSLLRCAYVLERARPDGAGFGTHDAFRIATAGGAAVVGLAGVAGALHPGLAADLTLLRADAPPIAAAHEPVAAVVYQADPSTVDTVLVNGQVVKRNGQLLGQDLYAVIADLERAAAHLVRAT